MFRRHNNFLIQSSLVPSLSASIRSASVSNNNEQNQNISSFLQRLLESSRNFSLDYNNNSNNSENNNILINNIFNEMIQNSSTIEDIFSQTDVRFHSIRVPVQREKAKLRAMKRKSQQQPHKKKNLTRNSSISNDDDKMNDVGHDIERQNRDDDDERGEIHSDDRQDRQADKDVLDPTTTVKSLTNDQSREATRKLKRLPFVNHHGDTKFSNNSNNSQQQHHQYKLPVKIICSAAKDMREDRFCVYLQTITEKIRVRYGALQADNFAGLLCRFWLNAQKNAGLSFPSSETAYSPLLPTMLFFSAARDPELFKELVLRIDRERGRFSSHQNQNNKNNNSPSSSQNNTTNNYSNRYGISSFTSSAMVGWIAAVSVTIETAIPVLRKNLLDLQKESSNSNNKSKDLKREIVSEEVHDKTNIVDSSNIVDVAAKKLQKLLVDERCFTVASPIDAIRVVLPVVLSVLLNPLATSPNSTSTTASFFQLRQNLPPISIVSFIAGTKQSASSFELWNKFTKRLLLLQFNDGNSQQQQQSSKVNNNKNNNQKSSNFINSSSIATKRKIYHSFANSPIPPYFVSFVLQTCLREADALLSPTKASQVTSIPGRVTPTTPAALMSSRNKFGAVPLILSNNHSTNITATMDEIVGLAVGTFARAMRDSIVLTATMNNIGNRSQQQLLPLRDKVPFILYSRLLRALASCGCASWVMETVVKDCLAVLHGHTSLNLCHVVANAMHHQKTREAMLLCTSVQRDKICEDDFYSKWVGHAACATANESKDKALNRLRHHQNFVLLPFYQNQQISSLSPVDTVNCSISNDMWNTLVDACTLLVSSSSSSAKEKSNESDDKEFSSSPSCCSLPPVLLRQLTFTRIRSSCLELVSDPSKIFDLLNILQQRPKDDVAEKENFENFLLKNVTEDEGTNTSWCDPVVVLPKWLDELAASSSSSSSSSVFSELRLQSLSCLLAALADISVEVRNVFSSPRSSSSTSLSRLEIATAAARLVDYIVEKSLFEDNNSNKNTSQGNDEERNSKHKNFENFIPVYWETVCTIAVTTKDVHWLHDQYLFLMLMTPNNFNGNKNGGGSTTTIYGAKLLARHLTPSILKKTCHVLVQNFGTSTDIRFYRIEEGTASSTPSVSSRCVALNKLLQRICKYTGQYSLQLFLSMTNNNNEKVNRKQHSSFIMSLIDSDPDVDFCLRPKQRVGSSTSFEEYDQYDSDASSSSSPSSALTPILQYYHQDRMKSKKSVLELNTSVANQSFGGSQFGLVVEAGRGLVPHRNAVAACAVPTMSAIHPSTANAVQVALQGAHSSAPFSVASDVVFAKKMSWRTSGIGRQSRSIFLADHQQKREFEEEEEIEEEEGDDQGEDMMMVMKGARDCITDIIEGYAK